MSNREGPGRRAPGHADHGTAHRSGQSSDGRSGRRRRGLMFTVAPAVLALLLVVAMAVVIRQNLRKEDGRAIAAPGGGQVSLTITPAASEGSRTTTSTTTPTPTTPPDDPALAKDAVDAADATSTSRVELGVAVLDRDTGQVTVGEDGTAQFYSASVLKLFVITDLFHQQETGAITLSASDMNYITLALEQSDDNAMDALWEEYDGPATIQQLSSLANLQDTALPSDLSQWGETVISARDVVAVYQYIFTSLTAADRNTILGDLNNAANSGADGFDQSFGLLEPQLRTSTTKAKQGWMDYGSQMMLHTTGVVGGNEQYVVAILSLQRMSIGWSAGEANMNRATAALLKGLGPTATQ